MRDQDSLWVIDERKPPDQPFQADKQRFWIVVYSDVNDFVTVSSCWSRFWTGTACGATASAWLAASSREKWRALPWPLLHPRIDADWQRI
jgi:hypothetical protein